MAQNLNFFSIYNCLRQPFSEMSHWFAIAFPEVMMNEYPGGTSGRRYTKRYILIRDMHISWHACSVTISQHDLLVDELLLCYFIFFFIRTLDRGLKAHFNEKSTSVWRGLHFAFKTDHARVVDLRCRADLSLFLQNTRQPQKHGDQRQSKLPVEHQRSARTRSYRCSF